MSEHMHSPAIAGMQPDRLSATEPQPISPVAGVDVWYRDVSRAPADIRVLSYDELERAQRFREARDRLSFEAGRSWIRGVLSRYLDMAPEKIKFQKGPFGKPYLDARQSVFFNWSHTDGIWVLAVSHHGPVGVDVELISRRTDRHAVAAVALHKTEQRYISEQPDPDWSFLNIWVRREALFKAVGFGLHDTMQQISIIDPSAPDLSSVTGPDGRLWSLCDVKLGEEVQCALAYEAPSPIVQSTRKH